MVANGYIETGSGVRGGDRVTYGCNPGFTLAGDRTITCLSNNTWSQTPSCRGMYLLNAYDMNETDTYQIKKSIFPKKLIPVLNNLLPLNLFQMYLIIF